MRVIAQRKLSSDLGAVLEFYHATVCVDGLEPYTSMPET